VRVVITRAENEALHMAQAIQKIGCEPLVASMLEIQLFDDPINLKGFQGVLVTSGNAVRALEKATDDRDIPIYCIGPQSRKLAESVGFKNVRNSYGNHKNLPNFLARETTPTKGPLLFLHGGNLAWNPVQDLGKAGFRTVLRKAYIAGPITTLPEDVKAEFEKPVAPEFATFMSIRTFKLFRELMQKEGLLPKLRDTIAVCISPAVADFAREVRWKKVYSADEMTGPSVVSKIEELKESIGATS
jgi:uroporphyrinogen-III synthase